jgi:hypothetical protein
MKDKKQKYNGYQGLKVRQYKFSIEKKIKKQLSNMQIQRFFESDEVEAKIFLTRA